MTGNSQPLQQEIVKTPLLDVGALEIACRQEFIHPSVQNLPLDGREDVGKGKFGSIRLEIQDFLEFPQKSRSIAG
jgi:hypothetical protein